MGAAGRAGGALAAEHGRQENARVRVRACAHASTKPDKHACIYIRMVRIVHGRMRMYTHARMRAHSHRGHDGGAVGALGHVQHPRLVPRQLHNLRAPHTVRHVVLHCASYYIIMLYYILLYNVMH